MSLETGAPLPSGLADEQVRRCLSRVAPEVVDSDPAQEIRAERDLYHAMIESLSEGLVITDTESRIIYVNTRMEQIAGRTRDQLLGKLSYEVLLPPEDWPKMRQRLAARLEGKEESYEVTLRRSDGRDHWVTIKATPYRTCGGEIIGTIGAISCIGDRKALEMENEYLHDEIRLRSGHMIGDSAVLQKVMAQIATVAPTDANVLILGESGTGKELAAAAIHDLSARKDRPLVRVNCASIPKELFESEFFGHVRGAFTGAIKDRIGRFELADGGTLFLDEIGEIPLDLQGKLLRVLQEGQFERLGEDRTRSVKVRIIAATNRDLLAESKAGRFRLDLYYRLSVFPIEMPPLRERMEDIGLLAEHFIRQASRRLGVPRPKLTRLQVHELQSYDWPGNVRELQNVIERAVILARGGKLPFDLPERRTRPESAAPAVMHAVTNDSEVLSLDELIVREREIVSAALRRCGGKIYGADGAAALLNIKPTTLASKMKRLKIGREKT